MRLTRHYPCPCPAATFEEVHVDAAREAVSLSKAYAGPVRQAERALSMGRRKWARGLWRVPAVRQILQCWSVRFRRNSPNQFVHRVMDEFPAQGG
jgi:hypothetical protein